MPYVYIPSKEDLGSSASTKRPTSCIMVVGGGTAKKEGEFEKLYEEMLEDVKELNEKLITTV